MGQAISAARASIKAADEEAKDKAKQDLDVLAKALDSQLNEFEARLDSRFLNPSSTEKLEIPGNRALRKARFANVMIKDKPSKGIASAVDEFFGISNSGVDTQSAVLGGFKKVVSSALDGFMSNTEVGQHKEEKYFIYMQHNAVVRLDVMAVALELHWEGLQRLPECHWIPWSPENPKLRKNVDIVCTSIVDVAALKTSEFVYLISEYAGDNEAAVVEYTSRMEKLYDAARRMKLTQSRKERQGLIDDDAPITRVG